MWIRSSGINKPAIPVLLLTNNKHRLQYIYYMKFLPFLVFIGIMFYVLPNVSTDNWNIGIYGLFVCFVGYKLFQNLRQLYMIRRSPVCEGLIISYEKQKPAQADDINFDIEVKFYSPAGDDEYSVRSTIETLPKDGLVDVVFDEAHPRHSKVYPKFSLWNNIFLGLALIFFIYQLLKTIFIGWSLTVAASFLSA